MVLWLQVTDYSMDVARVTENSQGIFLGTVCTRELSLFFFFCNLMCVSIWSSQNGWVWEKMHLRALVLAEN